MRFPLSFRDLTYSVPWNLWLLTSGSILIAFGLKSIAIPQGFVSGGAGGVAMLLYYIFGGLEPGAWYLVINIPIFILGWLWVSKRFFLYTLYGTIIVGVFMDVITYTAPISDPILAMLASGAVIGAGTGITLRSLGSTGGTDIIAIILNQKLNVRIGNTYFTFNVFLFAASLAFLNLDIVLYSLAMVFILGLVTDHFLSLFNQRKLVLIVSDLTDAIANEISEKINKGSTFLYGRGSYTGRRKKVLLTVINNYQVKRLEEIVYGVDPYAFTIVENTWHVLGSDFAKRKVY
ncbi:YitT family protein [Desulfohalobium retbaense]|uniref:DUF2179 domain-containing protein n=1 Tax=Desulfohalobium retbaense (strain ATCC 49708 / DSM 5692 / JCM 16813 / HR100) TaxID=485915 RepID=C8X4B7_DESRD|nr:YitT family protein [Desulfohalobium retbaense]ACV69391.1 Protein of unknown function DUF2179 [Desulfohalobium retbaense DSM 5692]